MRLLISLLFLLVGIAATTEATAEVEPIADEQKVISVKSSASDADVRARIHTILDASGWFQNSEVTNITGIVTLSGTTGEAHHREWAERIASRTETVIAVINKIEVVNRNPWSLAPLVDQTQDLVERSMRHLPAVFIGLLILLLSIFIAKKLAAATRRVLQQRIDSLMLRNLVGRLVAFPALVLGIYLVFNISGLGNLATTLIGGTGLLGLIIGIAFRDITENFLASILLSIQRPFVMGDMIQVLQFTGMVEAMTTRGTVLMTLDGNHVQIPNTIIYKEPITNFSANPNIRQTFTVGIGYDNAISRVQQLIFELLEKHSAVLNDPEPLILADELGASTVNLKIYFWVDSTRYSFLKVRSSVIRNVKFLLMQEGVSMPDDAREIIFPEGIRVFSQIPGNTPEDTSAERAASTGISEVDATVTQAEGDLTSEKAQLKQQATNGVLGDKKTNLLEP